jgi:hypothetical protein
MLTDRGTQDTERETVTLSRVSPTLNLVPACCDDEDDCGGGGGCIGDGAAGGASVNFSSGAAGGASRTGISSSSSNSTTSSSSLCSKNVLPSYLKPNSIGFSFPRLSNSHAAT